MKLENIGLLGIDSIRTRAYLNALKKNNLIPSVFIQLKSSGPAASLQHQKTKYFNNVLDPKSYCSEYEIPLVNVQTCDVNDAKLIDAIRAHPQCYWIYSGPAGALIRKPLFETKKKFLHIHPGILPDFKGSTTIYYSILKKTDIGCTALFLNEKIDSGDIIKTSTFPQPEDKLSIDQEYDPYIRSQLLAQVLHEYVINNCEFKINKQEELGETYYIIHPLLKHIAILS